MKLTLYPKIIFRTPRFSLQDDLHNNWDELKIAISESSQEFFIIIKNVEAEDIPKLPRNVQHTIWKYFNRSKHRSTPFGTFASVGIADVGVSVTGDTLLRIDESMKIHRFPDWRLKSKFEYDFEDLKFRNGYLFSNSTYYKLGENIRYVSLNDGKFEIEEMIPDHFVLRLLHLCSTPISLEEAVLLLLPFCENRSEIEEGIASMIDMQLLITSFDPNIIGEDYFARIDFEEKSVDKHYIISERVCNSGKYNPYKLRYLQETINFLERNLGETSNPRLSEFVKRFRKRFDGQEVPIMEALDPEVGIGYSDMEESNGSDSLVLDLAGNKNGRDIDKNRIREILSKQMGLSTDCLPQHLFLEEMIVDKLHQDSKPLPNTFNVLFTEADGNIFLEHIGGVTATALAGRFTLASSEIWDYAKEMVEIEEKANPDVVFFDIAYTAENEVDNVNRRKRIYQHQLSLFNYDTSQTPITSDDILVSLQGDNLILRSKKFGRRLVPRLASAYNHSRSDLPVFRLLCDLQFQGLTTTLQFRVENFYPDLNHYPRIQYKNIILSPEKWRLKIDGVKSLEKAELKSYLSKLKTVRHLRSGVGDQMLYFDTESECDLDALLHYLKQNPVRLFEESFIPQNSIIQNNAGNPFASQFMATLVHSEQIYNTINQKIDTNLERLRYFLPGSEWLYFEIYCHPSRMENLLCNSISEYLEAYHDKIKKWFFIRYDEEGAHIRLRIRLKSPNDGQNLTYSMSQFLKKEYVAGLVSDIRIRIYMREIERYGSDIIGEVERHFSLDSQYTLELLKGEISTNNKYYLCIQLLQKIQMCGLQGIGTIPYLTATILQSLQKEHYLNTDDFSKINKKFKEFRQNGTLDQLEFSCVKLFESFYTVLTLCPLDRRNKLLMDLFHMHVNRLFTEHQRTHEMLIYYFLDKMSKANTY